MSVQIGGVCISGEVINTLNNIEDALDRKTEIVDRVSQIVEAGESFEIINASGSGRLHEIAIASPSTEMEITITVDGEEKLKKTYNQLRVSTQFLKDISAFAELDEDGNATGNYIIHVKNYPFRTSFIASVKNISASSVTFTVIFAKCEVEGD